MTTAKPQPKTWIDRLIWFSLTHKLVVFLVLGFGLFWGVLVAPFDWRVGQLPRDPVPVDAIPDLGENQQIVFTQWQGRSPQDIEDQITYPLTSALLGVPKVKTVRSQSYFGFSSIYVIFKESADFYWSRSRILEKLNSLPPGTIPEGVQPMLGPDATALGQVYWYTIEGRDPQGQPTGGWDLHELRTVQDWYVRYGLLGADGVSEVASIGGFVREYQIDVDPEAMLVNQVSLEEIFMAVKNSNEDVGARNIEINRVEYFIRGVGYIKSLDDIRDAVVKTRDNVPIYIKDLAVVSLGPAQRRGVLDKGGAEVVGGVVIGRFGENPLKVIDNVKMKIAEISPGLPQKTLVDGTVSKLTIVPFYDRSGLIHETLDTLKTALSHEILVTILVILLMLMNLRSAMLVSSLLPGAVLLTFVTMKYAGVDANIVALSGIAIAIGTMVDMGIVIVENIFNDLEKLDENGNALYAVYHASSEVGSAVLTAVCTTVISFLPVFIMEGAEGKLFRPLAFTKTFALLTAILVSLFLIPPLTHMLFRARKPIAWMRWVAFGVLFLLAVFVAMKVSAWLLPLVLAWGAWRIWGRRLPPSFAKWLPLAGKVALALMVAGVLTAAWVPLGPERGLVGNYLFVAGAIGIILGFFQVVQFVYPKALRWALDHRLLCLSVPLLTIALGAMVWFGFPRMFGWLPASLRTSGPGMTLAKNFPGLGKEFMPPLDEGSFLYMPTTSVHAAINEAKDVLQTQDVGFTLIPEVAMAVGKLGRAETSLDPAPISMIETVINYKPQFLTDDEGHRRFFDYDAEAVDWWRDAQGNMLAGPDGQPYKVRGQFLRDDAGALVEAKNGMPFRQWRPALEPGLNPGRKAWRGIRSPDDIWDEIVRMGKLPGTTSAPKLQPIAARIVMLQSGLRAPMGIKIKGPDLDVIEAVGLQFEKWLKQAPGVAADTVIADRIIGKPYLEFHLDRRAMARYGMKLVDTQRIIELAIGGKRITTTVEGRERYGVRVRYQRELRDTVGKLERIVVPTPSGAQIPLSDIADLRYTTGPQVIKSEDTFLVSYVIFDKLEGLAEVDVVEHAREFLAGKIAGGELEIPHGVSYRFVGSYQNQVRASNKLKLVLPLALLLIFMILYLQFKSVATTTWIFSAILVAWAGGFLMIWCYGQSWFLDIDLFGVNLRSLFQVGPINLSVAIWVGFLALFGIASDDGVLITTYLDQSFAKHQPQSVAEIRDATVIAGRRRIRPALMTSATTVLALLPILTSTGRGSDIMKPMAIPTFGGMLVVVMTVFVVPLLYAWTQEVKLKHGALFGNQPTSQN